MYSMPEMIRLFPALQPIRRVPGRPEVHGLWLRGCALDEADGLDEDGVWGHVAAVAPRVGPAALQMGLADDKVRILAAPLVPELCGDDAGPAIHGVYELVERIIEVEVSGVVAASPVCTQRDVQAVGQLSHDVRGSNASLDGPAIEDRQFLAIEIAQEREFGPEVFAPAK